MLKIYNAISKTTDIALGGTTKPWVVTVEDNSGIKEYVVKLFSNKDEKDYQPTNKEFYSCILADECELSVPRYALIKFNKDFINSLEKEDQQRMKEIGRNYFFGSELIYPKLDYSDALTNKHLESYDIESIFAFDVLIRNTDRREQKPNIFFQKDTYYLIDHEQTLYIDKGFTDYYNTSNRWSFIYKDIKGEHLFYRRLRNNKKNVSFDTFEYYLSVLNLNNLHKVAVKLKEKGFDTNDYAAIRSYLEEVKLNQSKFITLLHELIQ